MAEAVERLGGIDVVSNNAGVELRHGPTVARTTDAEWELVMDVNVSGTFRVCRAALPHLGPGASIVNMGSINSFIAWPNDAAYTTSKGAVPVSYTHLLLASSTTAATAHVVGAQVLRRFVSRPQVRAELSHIARLGPASARS